MPDCPRYGWADDPALRQHCMRWGRLYERAYFDVQTVLDRYLGTGADDGAGEGIAADVDLLGRQRDEARAEVARLLAGRSSP